MVMQQTMQNLIERYIAEVKKIYGVHLHSVILYGSYARGDFKPDSVLDIKPIAQNEDHFRKWVVNYPFYANIHKEGVVLYGAA